MSAAVLQRQQRKVALENLNKDENAGKELFQEEMRKMSLKSDNLLKSDAIKAQTGVCHITCYRRDRILAFLQDRQKWKDCDDYVEEKDILKEKMLSHKAPSNWQYKFRIKKVGRKDILQRGTTEFNKNAETTTTGLKRRKLMKEKDWCDVICIDESTFFNKLNAIHWNKNPIRHLKGQGFYHACVDVLSSNVSMEICKILAQNCQVCKPCH